MNPNETRVDRIMRGAAAYAAYYRHNPHRFAEDYLHIRLKLFQKILLVMMNLCTTVVFIGCRGIGKTYLSALFCVIRAILWPGTQICIASGTRGQAINVLEKINAELKFKSRELAAEIDERESKINGTVAQVAFHNGSRIKVVTASDSARGNRANILLLDEFRLIDRDTIDLVLRKFLTLRRMPDYSELTEAERQQEYDKEKNMTLWLSSAYMIDHWSYTKCVDTLQAMMDDSKKQFVCGLPYQLSIAEGLLDRDMIADEMAESDFNELKFLMEYAAMWWGNTEGSFFDFTTIARNRRIKYPMLPDKLAGLVGGSPKVRITPKQNGEVRILSVDIALMKSGKGKNNDATAIFINQLLPTKAGRFSSNIVYGESHEGLHTVDQALIVRKLFDEFQCDYIVIDAAGVGLGCYDSLVRDMVDSETGEIYPALSCCNDPDMAARCTTPGAEKAIWSVKASAQFNSDCAFMLREAFRSGRIRLLMNEYDAEEQLESIKGYSSLSANEKVRMQLPYIHTTLLVDELTKLQYEESGGNRVKLYERAGMRKDRYSSLGYNYYVATQLESKLGRRRRSGADIMDYFSCRPPKQFKKKGGAR